MELSDKEEKLILSLRQKEQDQGVIKVGFLKEDLYSYGGDFHEYLEENRHHGLTFDEVQILINMFAKSL